jgi:flagellar hook-length control protein FliK
MDVQSVSKAQKTSLLTTVSAQADSANPENAFSALLNLVGVKFNTGSAIGGMESKLMHSNDAAHAVQAEARDASQTAPRAVAKPKSTKSDDKDAKTAKDGDNADTATAAATTDTTSTTDAAAADQAQAAVQAAVAATVALPIVAQVQAAPVVAAIQQVAVTPAVTGPVDAAVQTAAAAVDANVTAAATVTAPQQIAAAAPVIQKAAGPVVEQTKAADTGPKTFQTTATAAAATDTSADVDTAAANLNTVTSAKAATAKTDATGPKEIRSAAAVDQSQGMSRMLGDDNKIQVQVHVGGKAAAQTFADANPYNIYSGYTGTAEGSTANGQAGNAGATNALVQTAKTATEAQVPVSPIVLPPQLQSQQAQAPTATAARADASAPIQALESTGSSQNNSQNGDGLDSFGNQAQRATATGETRAASQTATDRPQVTPQQIVDQIKVVITRAAKAGLDKVTIQLKPLELGRIDVKLEMSADHKVSVTVTADNKETLALLQSDSKTLESTLNDAGLRTDSANLHFSLRSESDARQAEQNAGNGKSGGAAANDANVPDLDALEFDYAAAARTRGGVDTFA